jgi:hypothetical protein
MIGSQIGSQTPRLICRVFLVLLAASGAVGADEPPAVQSGTWQKHQYSFVSLGFTSTYSCDGLADKLKRLLLAAGARADAKALPGACASEFGHVEKLARAELAFYTLVPDQGAKTPDGPRADGVWRSVALAANSPRELGVGDCELVEQFRAQLLPMFTIRSVADQTTCVPHQESGSVINLKFETFAAAPAPPAAPRP